MKRLFWQGFLVFFFLSSPLFLYSFQEDDGQQCQFGTFFNQHLQMVAIIGGCLYTFGKILFKEHQKRVEALHTEIDELNNELSIVKSRTDINTRIVGTILVANSHDSRKIETIRSFLRNDKEREAFLGGVNLSDKQALERIFLKNNS
ncbi:hypothetical protein K9K77_03085 [Candidatus Babeliales bacterium]|nr:hypothetical protein [Candidatus Babeliales bacterium]